MRDLVSVIVPVYNADPYLEECILSVLNQTYSNWELLLVNDGSMDRSEEIALSFVDQRIKYFEQENKGVSAARNLGLHHMNGDFFCFLDADDIFTQKSLESRIGCFYEDNELNFVDGIVENRSRYLNEVKSTWIPSFTGKPLYELLQLKDSCFLGITWMIKRKKGIQYQFDEKMKFAEDLWFYIDLAKNGWKYSYVYEVVYYRRRISNSATTDMTKLATGYKNLYDKIKELGLLNESDLMELRKKIKRIVIKSALGKRRFALAMRELFSRL
ncbi:MAG: glycosyltransferase family 2 protein [Bacteroidota bacterium]